MTSFFRTALYGAGVSALMVAASAAQAATVATWTFESAVISGSSTTFGPIAADVGTGAATGSHATASTYSSPSGNGSARSFSSNTWAVGDYYQFSTSTVGFSAVALTFDQMGSGTGPRDFSLSFSIDGGTTFSTLASYTVANIAWNGTTAVAGTSYSFAAAGASNAASVLFRLTDTSTSSIGGGTVASGGTSRVDNFSITGNVAAVPEPETWALMLAGLGLMGAAAIRRRKD